MRLRSARLQGELRPGKRSPEGRRDSGRRNRGKPGETGGEVAVAWPRTEGRLTVKTGAGPRCFPGLVRADGGGSSLPAGLLVLPSCRRPLVAQLARYLAGDVIEPHGDSEHGADGPGRVPASTWDAILGHIRDPADAALPARQRQRPAAVPLRHPAVPSRRCQATDRRSHGPGKIATGLNARPAGRELSKVVSSARGLLHRPAAAGYVTAGLPGLSSNGRPAAIAGRRARTCPHPACGSGCG